MVTAARALYGGLYRSSKDASMLMDVLHPDVKNGKRTCTYGLCRTYGACKDREEPVSVFWMYTISASGNFPALESSYVVIHHYRVTS